MKPMKPKHMKPQHMTPQQAINNFRLLTELSPRNTYEQYQAAVQEIANTMMRAGIKDGKRIAFAQTP